MKISVAQIQPEKGEIERNISLHKKWIRQAITCDTNVIIFPELSLTGYVPELAMTLATSSDDPRLNEFQQISDLKGITISVGLPTRSEAGVHISMIIFQPSQPKTMYLKQLLDTDELLYFVPGTQQVVIDVGGTKIVPAICYESLQAQHFENAKKLGMELYVASVAKTNKGIKKATQYFPKVAKDHSIPMLMSNSIGKCGNFESVGHSSVWNEKGALLGQLDNKNEGMLTFDTETKQLVIANTTTNF